MRQRAAFFHELLHVLTGPLEDLCPELQEKFHLYIVFLSYILSTLEFELDRIEETTSYPMGLDLSSCPVSVLTVDYGKIQTRSELRLAVLNYKIFMVKIPATESFINKLADLSSQVKVPLRWPKHIQIGGENGKITLSY